MTEPQKLITNTPYESLFSSDTVLRKDNYISPSISDLDSADSAQLSLYLGLLFEKIDPSSTLYGVEITCNGKGRNIRIPLVRVNDKSQTVWKVVSDVKKIERASEVLEDVIFFLKENNTSGYPIPLKVVVLTEGVETLKNNEEFLRKVAEKDNLIIFNINILKSMIEGSNVSGLEKLLQRTGSINIL